jgi:hypothetical protein
VPQPLQLAEDQPENRIHQNFFYPVTLCGGIAATSKDEIESEYHLQNSSLVVYLKTSRPEVLKRLHLLKGIFPHRAGGCVHGRYLPTNVGGRLVFAIEQESISIAS